MISISLSNASTVYPVKTLKSGELSALERELARLSQRVTQLDEVKDRRELANIDLRATEIVVLLERNLEAARARNGISRYA